MKPAAGKHGRRQEVLRPLPFLSPLPILAIHSNSWFFPFHAWLVKHLTYHTSWRFPERFEYPDQIPDQFRFFSTNRNSGQGDEGRFLKGKVLCHQLEKQVFAKVLLCSGCHQHRNFSMTVIGLLSFGQGNICGSVAVPPIFKTDGYHFWGTFIVTSGWIPPILRDYKWNLSLKKYRPTTWNVYKW